METVKVVLRFNRSEPCTSDDVVLVICDDPRVGKKILCYSENREEVGHRVIKIIGLSSPVVNFTTSVSDLLRPCLFVLSLSCGGGRHHKHSPGTSSSPLALLSNTFSGLFSFHLNHQKELRSS